MPAVRPAGPFPIPGIDLETWIIRFDKNGVCTSPQTRAALMGRVAQQNAPILVFSHGWNNDFADAINLYRRFLDEFEATFGGKQPNPLPLFVGITWPSIWLPSDEGPQMATAPDPGDAAVRERVVNELVEALPPGADLREFYGLMEKDRLDDGAARRLAALLSPVLRPSAEGPDEAPATEDTILASLRALQFTGEAADADDLDAIGTVDDGGTAGSGQGPGAAGGLDWLDPRWALRLATLYIMKDRAGLVGRTGIADLLADILAGSAAPVHLIGHSFGAKVVLSAVAAPAALPRLVQSMLLLQPAVSYQCFSNNVRGRGGPGAYRKVLDRVVGTIFSTYSAYDIPLHKIYHRALLRRVDLGEGLRTAAASTSAGAPPSDYAALGGYGPRGAGEHLIDPIPSSGQVITVPDGVRLIGLDGTKNKRIDGHGGVATPFTAWALRCQMKL